MIGNTLLAKSVKDFFTPAILKLALLPFLLTLVVMYALFFWAADAGLDALQDSYVKMEQQSRSVDADGTPHTRTETVELTGAEAVLAFLLKHSVTSWMVTFFVYTLGSFVVLMRSLGIALFIIGFLTPRILAVIGERHYGGFVFEGFGNVATVLFAFLKTLLITLALLLLLIPLYFVPVVGVVAFNLPFYYLFHNLLVYDVASTLCTKEEYGRILYRDGMQIRLQTLLMYLVSLIPFAALAGSVFFVIYLGHGFFSRALILRHRAESLPDAL